MAGSAVWNLNSTCESYRRSFVFVFRQFNRRSDFLELLREIALQEKFAVVMAETFTQMIYELIISWYNNRTDIRFILLTSDRV